MAPRSYCEGTTWVLSMEIVVGCISCAKAATPRSPEAREMAKHLPRNRMVYSSVDWNEETHDSCSKNIRLVLVPSIDLRGCPIQPHPPESPGFGKADAIALGSTEQALGRAIPADFWNAS